MPFSFGASGSAETTRNPSGRLTIGEGILHYGDAGLRIDEGPAHHATA
jgi:hypothetical protein